ncbi:MAG TPA: DUF4145 domain-containing protein [Blastocatellia bacterium]|nr:DUF4145 domain-containing protein [Blastocatellia bacterium]
MAEIKYTQDETAGNKVKVACKECGADKNHVVMRSVEEAGSDDYDEGYSFEWRVSYQIVQCQGCDTVSFRSVSTNSEDFDPGDGYVETEQLYPNRVEGRSVLNGINLLPPPLQRIYQETIGALNGNQPVLSGIGIRAIVETVVKQRKASGRDLLERIDHLVQLRMLTQDGAAILHKLRGLGNRAAHEVKAHTTEELALAMDVIEHLLQAVYILPKQAKRTFR